MDTLADKRRRRGEITQSDLMPFQSLPKQQLFDLLISPVAMNRTIAATVLGSVKESSVVISLCSQLKIEKKLYCKIAISDALANIGSLSVQPLLNLLGEIGKNQETVIPEKGFKKTSYPLPRDIAARILCRMDSSILPDLFEFIVKAETPYTLEQAIDVLGHIIFTNKLIVSPEILLEIASDHDELSMVQFKIIRCFSGFKNTQVKEYLIDQLQSPHLGLKFEATRSLVLSGVGVSNTGCELPQEILEFAVQLTKISTR